MFATIFKPTILKIRIGAIVNRAILFLLVFTQFYALRLKGIHLSTRVILGVFGLILFLITAIKIMRKSPRLTIPSPIIGLGLLYVPIIVVSLISVFINGTDDIEFVKYPISPIITIFSAYFTINFAQKIYPKLSFNIIAIYLIQAVFVQAVLSIMMYFSQDFHDALYSFVELDPLEAAVTQRLMGQRLLGYGANLMILAIGNDVVLLLIAMLLKDRKKQVFGAPVNTFWLIFSFIFISIIGMMQARTTTIGIIFGLAYLFFPQITKFKLNDFVGGLKNFGAILLYVVTIAGAFIIFFPDFIKSSQGLLNYGFEMVNNYADNGTLSTRSTDILLHMYTVYPETLRTWVIGDAKFYNVAGQTSSAYYMSIDIGYLRLIFYFGIIGCIAYLVYQIAFIWQSFNYVRKYYQLVPYYFITFILFFNAKGFTDLTQYVALFWVYGFFYKKQLARQTDNSSTHQL
jgi:hypothetical protein